MKFLRDKKGQGLMEYLGVAILVFIVLGTMALTMANTTVGRSQEVDSWISGI